ncbi:MAG TPA: DPP IV N-terminal domain-containing protein [Terriglobales bacterium]|nr:DPP IV N-terminal domain-containing protein [Terriglobales bacterium]
MQAQYFGRNKVHPTLNFQVLRTKDFDIYFYPSERAGAYRVGQMAERWDARLSRILHHQLSSRQPVIVYADQPDFMQTTTIPGFIGEGVGGVTEPVRRRVVIPLAGSLEGTNHVLGHELVHAFQFDMTARHGGRAAEAPRTANLPLWFVEGMAEYLSLGPVDSETAMWMREALLQDRFPTVKQLDSPKYFPYRFGQAFWAYVGGRYGDEAIGKMLREAGPNGTRSIPAVLKTQPAAFSAAWRQAMETAYEPVLRATRPVDQTGKVIINERNGGALNVSPAVSPDGKFVMFLSSKDLLAVDLYLADAETGKILRRITSTATSPHYLSLEFINSAGAWSRDGRQFAFARVTARHAEFAIYDLRRNEVVRTWSLSGIGEVFSPTWSPDGRQIAFSAIRGGDTDLYLLNLNDGAVTQLTDDAYADLQPAWSPDGRSIAFATDRFTTNLAELAPGLYRLAIYDVATHAIRELPGFAGAKNINPQWSPDGRSLYFVSDAGGISNLYRLNLATGTIAAITNIQTGVAGITATSPAVSVAAESGTIVFSAFTAGRRGEAYALVRLAPTSTAPSPAAVLAGLHANVLPPRTAGSGEVAAYLRDWRSGLIAATGFASAPYHAHLELVSIAPPQVLLGASPFGALVGGGTALNFEDLLGYHHLTIGVEAVTGAGTANFLRNLSALGLYRNQRHHWTWGLLGGQVPFVSAAVASTPAVINGTPVFLNQTLTFWELDRQALSVLAYPVSRAMRIEFQAGFENIGFAEEQTVDVISAATGNLLGSQTQDVPAPAALNFAEGNAAWVYDTSVFGGASPIAGQSARLQAGIASGSLDFSTVLTDYRDYWHLARPLSAAVRVLHYGRYGGGADDQRLQSFFLGYPWLVCGYSPNSFSTAECGPQFNATGACPVFDRLLGTRIGVLNAELRLELTGPLGLVAPSLPPIELAPFFDGGVAWTHEQEASIFGGPRHPVSSEGLTLRFNLFGFAVAQISVAYPNNRPLVHHLWEFALIPGF